MKTEAGLKLICRVCSKPFAGSMKGRRTLMWAVYKHVGSHRLSELYPAKYEFAMNKKLVDLYIDKRIVKVKTYSLIKNLPRRQ